MSAYRLSELWCDECYDKLSEEGTFADIRELARGEGWSRTKGRDLCHKCTPEAAA